MLTINTHRYMFVKKTGVILGVSISIGFIMICLCSIYCRRKFENSRSLRNGSQPTNSRVLSRNGNGCCAEQSSTSVNQQANATSASNEIELAVLCPSSPLETNPHSDAKVININLLDWFYHIHLNQGIMYDVLHRVHNLMEFLKFVQRNPYYRHGR